MSATNDIIIHDNETVDDLQTSGFKIIQSENHFKFSIDAVLLSHFPNVKNNAKVMDMCSGTGIVGLLICANTNAGQIDLVEIQEYLCDMSTRSIMLNNVENKMACFNIDIKQLHKNIKNEQYDVVTCNPPYLKVIQGKNSEDYTKRISRFEEACTIEDICFAAFKMLKNKGKFAMVHRAERMAEAMDTMRKNKLEPKRLRIIHSKTSAKAVLFLVEGIKNAKENIIIEEPLYIYNEDGTYTDEIYKIYNMGKN